MNRPLEHYYGGDRAWRGFVESLPDYEGTLSDKSWGELNDRVRDPDLARAIRFHYGDYAVAWLDQKVPALNGVTPISCLKSHSRVKRLREMLMRVPC